MLMVRRKCGRWIHCIHEKTGEPISFQIRDVSRVGSEFQVTIAIQDEPHNYQVLKPGDHDQGPLTTRRRRSDEMAELMSALKLFMAQVAAELAHTEPMAMADGCGEVVQLAPAQGGLVGLDLDTGKPVKVSVDWKYKTLAEKPVIIHVGRQADGHRAGQGRGAAP